MQQGITTQCHQRKAENLIKSALLTKGAVSEASGGFVEKPLQTLKSPVPFVKGASE
jgi:hypothetical protein